MIKNLYIGSTSIGVPLFMEPTITSFVTVLGFRGLGYRT